mmetsp:Transcript_90877/g.189989  ORF Transcript_90877/g.189989 Transcript_90877/m.189989 type:complete len:300 (+) Transcript_90877:904-1803(+)
MRSPLLRGKPVLPLGSLARGAGRGQAEAAVTGFIGQIATGRQVENFPRESDTTYSLVGRATSLGISHRGRRRHLRCSNQSRSLSSSAALRSLASTLRSLGERDRRRSLRSDGGQTGRGKAKGAAAKGQCLEDRWCSHRRWCALGSYRWTCSPGLGSWTGQRGRCCDCGCGDCGSGSPRSPSWRRHRRRGSLSHFLGNNWCCDSLWWYWDRPHSLEALYSLGSSRGLRVRRLEDLEEQEGGWHLSGAQRQKGREAPLRRPGKGQQCPQRGCSGAISSWTSGRFDEGISLHRNSPQQREGL